MVERFTGSTETNRRIGAPPKQKVGVLMDMQKEQEIERRVRAEFEEKQKKRREFLLEIVKAFIAPVVTAVLVLWLTK